jgi:hypothetical protein
MKSNKIYEVNIDDPKALKAFGELMIMLGFEEQIKNKYIEKNKHIKRKKLPSNE